MIILPLRFRTIVGISLILSIIMIAVMLRDSGHKEQYNKMEGKITYMDKRYHQWPVRDVGKYRYLQLDNYPYALELFIGKDWGDFSPRFEQVDRLKVGDMVAVYYYETNDVVNEGINRSVKFIDKNGVSYFEDGSAKDIMGAFVLAVNILLIIYTYYLWKKGKISY